MKRFLLSIFIILICSNVYAVKVEDLTENTAPTSDDIVYIVDDPGGTPLPRKVTLDNLGKGIGNLSPGGSSPELQWNNSSAFDGVNGSGVDSNGNIGIGSTTPRSILDIQGGNITIGTTSSSTVGSLYQNSNRVLHTYGTQNLFIGTGSGNYTLTGSGNTAVGYQSMDAMTSAADNVAVGWGALPDITDGVRNVAVGAGAMGGTLIASSSDNVAIGDDAMTNATDGYYNIAIGSNSLLAITSGQHNVAVGYDGCSDITQAGDYNTCIGSTAGGGGATLGLSRSTSIGYGSKATANNAMMLGGLGANYVNVGIGTSASAAMLEIAETGTTPFMISDGFGGGGKFLTVSTAGDSTFGDGTFNNNSVESDVYVTGNLEVDGTIYGDGSGLTNVSGSGLWSDNGTTVYVTSDYSDNIGIGTNSADAGLEIVALGSVPFMVSQAAAGNGDLLLITSSGNVGIGSTNPAGSFDVGSGSIYFPLDCSGNANGGAITASAAGLLSCTDDDGGGGSGDAVTVNSTAIDTTANLKDTATVTWAIVDGGAGGPDDAEATAIDLSCTDCINATEIEDIYALIAGDTFNGDVIVGGGTFNNATGGVDLYITSTLEVDGTIYSSAYGSDNIALTTNTTGNYTATIADAGNSTITVVNGTAEGGAVTLDAVDLNCTDCIGTTEITDSYLLNNGDTSTGDLLIGSGTFNNATGGEDLYVTSTLEVDGTIYGINVTSGANPGHTHTGTSLSSVDISDDTNLAVTAPVVLTDDTLSLNQNAGTDVTADLEEETHASEHEDGGADEIAVTAGMMNTGTGASSSTFWRGDNTWATPAGSGAWTSAGGITYLQNLNDNVGIGTNTSDAMLEIAELGTVPFMISNGASGNGDFVLVTSTGNVGLGSTTPQGKLDVNGSVFVPDGSTVKADSVVLAPPATCTVCSNQTDIREEQCDQVASGTGDEVEIQACIDAINAGAGVGATEGGSGGKGTVLLTEGLYTISNPILVYPGVAIIGQGIGGTKIKAADGFNSTMMWYDGGTSPDPAAAFYMERIFFDCNKDGTGTTSCTAFDSQKDANEVPLWDVRLYTNQFYNCEAGPCVIIDDPWGFRMIDNDIENSTDYALQININNGSITAFADAGGGQVTVTSTAHGLSNSDSVTITGTTNYNGTFTIANVAANTFEITDTWVSDDGTGTWTEGKYEGSILMSNKIILNTKGIDINGADAIQIIGNEINATGTDEYGVNIDLVGSHGNGTLVKDNKFIGGERGVGIGTSTVASVIQGNLFSGLADTSFEITDNGTNSYISGNRGDGNANTDTIPNTVNFVDGVVTVNSDQDNTGDFLVHTDNVTNALGVSASLDTLYMGGTSGNYLDVNLSTGVMTYHGTATLSVDTTAPVFQYVGDTDTKLTLANSAWRLVDLDAEDTLIIDVATATGGYGGRLGIGTSSLPDAKIETVAGGDTPFMVSATASGNGDYLIVTSAGNVGIGDNTPETLLKVAGTGTITTITDGTATLTGGSFTGLAGITSTGVIDFGGATSTEITNDGTVNAAGEITVDTTDNQLAWYGTAERVVDGYYTVCKTLESPAEADDNVPIFIAPEAITIRETACHIDAGTITSFTFQDSTDTTVDAPTCTTADTFTWDTSMSGTATLTKGEILEFDISTPSGIGWLTGCFRYSIDRQ